MYAILNPIIVSFVISVVDSLERLVIKENTGKLFYKLHTSTLSTDISRTDRIKKI